MVLPAIKFVDPKVPERGLNVRADVALFVGLVKLQAKITEIFSPKPPALPDLRRLPDWILRQWQELGYLAQRPETPEEKRKPLKVSMPDWPIRCESYAQFLTVFDPGGRRMNETGEGGELTSHMGLAVRAFFAEGGICCHVVRCGDPVAVMLEPKLKIDKFELIVPPPTSRHDSQSNWRGLEHVLGLEDVSMVLLPDLPDLCSGTPGVLEETFNPPLTPEIFQPAEQGPPTAYRPAPPLQLYAAPRLSPDEMEVWRNKISNALSLLGARIGGSNRRDIQLIAALPLRQDNPTLGTNALAEDDASRLQLTYPWVKTDAALDQPEGLQSSDAIVAGILARNALSRGAYKSAAGQFSITAKDVTAKLSDEELQTIFKDGILARDAVTQLGRDGSRVILLTDATLSPHIASRAASLRRLQGIVLRAARIAGEDLVFEANVESTWTRLRHRLEEYLTELWTLGAFDGASAQEAFFVRCGPSTTTQNDIDNGRMVAQITFFGAQPIESMTVTLEFGAAQTVSLRAA